VWCGFSLWLPGDYYVFFHEEAAGIDHDPIGYQRLSPIRPHSSLLSTFLLSISSLSSSFLLQINNSENKLETKFKIIRKLLNIKKSPLHTDKTILKYDNEIIAPTFSIGWKPSHTK
jgi:hypothetical protein